MYAPGAGPVIPLRDGMPRQSGKDSPGSGSLRCRGLAPVLKSGGRPIAARAETPVGCGQPCPTALSTPHFGRPDKQEWTDRPAKQFRVVPRSWTTPQVRRL